MTSALAQENQLSMGMQIRGGTWKVVPLALKSVHPTLVLANGQSGPRAASYQHAADMLLEDQRWNPKRIFVTSADIGDGKTTTAFNLAWALASRGKTVLLVELNLAQPQFQAVLGNPRIRHGVDSALRKTAPPSETVFSLGSDELNVAAVRSKMTRIEAKEYLRNLDSFLEWGGKEYEWLVMDCPSVLSSGWNSWFSSHVQEALLVVRAGHTPLVHVRKATHRLGSSLKGVLLNGVAESIP